MLLRKVPRPDHGFQPFPVARTADPDAIIEKLRRGKQVLEPIH